MSYAYAIGHLEMVYDDYRNGLYRSALSRYVTPDSVVMDLGAGIGLLGFLALAAGARRVVMVEPTVALDAAKVVATHLGLMDRIDFRKQRIEDCTDVEPVDCIVSVFTGNFLLEEDLLPSLFYARDKWLRPGGVLLPDRGVMECVPISDPVAYARHVDRWQQAASGIDLSSLRPFAANNIYPMQRAASESIMLAAPVPIFELDFNTATSTSCKVETHVDISETGMCHGLLGWFNSRLGESWLSTSPVAPRTHWSQLFLPLTEPMPVAAGERLEVSLTRPAFGDWTWSLAKTGSRQRQSTFLANPRALDSFQRYAKDHVPRLSGDGGVVKDALALFDGRRSRAEIEAGIRAQTGWPEDRVTALVARLINDYAGT